tara:strand:- start:5398 stop:5808 length:411 start_codon:yes stop_codon:yes gene_type:complete
MARRALFQEQEQSFHIDISPLLDVVFILLIFFIVTAVFVEESGLEINRPEAMSAEQLSKKSIFIAVQDAKNIWYGGARIGVAGIKPTLHQILSQRDLPVIIQADKSVPTELLIQVLDLTKSAGAKQVHVATRGGQT